MGILKVWLGETTAEGVHSTLLFPFSRWQPSYWRLSVDSNLPAGAFQSVATFLLASAGGGNLPFDSFKRSATFPQAHRGFNDLSFGACIRVSVH